MIVRRWRALLGMMIGVGLALGLGMMLLGIIAGTLDLYTRDFRLSGAELRVIARGGTPIPILPGDSMGNIKHANNVLAQIRGLPGVSEAVGVITWELERERPGPKRSDAPAELIAVMGIDGDPSRIPDTVVLGAGRWIRRGDELVVGSKLSREKGLHVGDTVRLQGRDFRVVGIGEVRGIGFQSKGVAYLERQSLQQRAVVGDLVNMIVIDTARPDLARERIREMDSLNTYDVAEMVGLAEAAQAADRVSHWVLTLMTLAIAALFVSNMLGESVAGRRLELGTMRAIGISNRTIVSAVAGEALVICTVAWVVGVAASTLGGWLINGYVAPAYGEESFYAADSGLFLSVLALALGLGIVAGVGPVRQAISVDPVEVLREA
jgi:ABC-type lipoprotein release transport system permease subunit